MLILTRTGGEKVETELGAHFVVPKGFEQGAGFSYKISTVPNDSYEYKNEELGMEIHASENEVGLPPHFDSARETIARKLSRSVDNFTERGYRILEKNAELDRWVLRGRDYDGMCFYSCEMASDDDDVCCAVTIHYPEDNARVGERIVNAFMKHFTYDR